MVKFLISAASWCATLISTMHWFFKLKWQNNCMPKLNNCRGIDLSWIFNYGFLFLINKALEIFFFWLFPIIWKSDSETSLYRDISRSALIYLEYLIMAFCSWYIRLQKFSFFDFFQLFGSLIMKLDYTETYPGLFWVFNCYGCSWNCPIFSPSPNK